MRKLTLLLLSAVLMLNSNGYATDVDLKPVLIGIYAKDYDTTVAWYCDNLGFEVTTENVVAGGNLMLAFLDNGSFELEIYADIEPDSTVARLARDRFGMPSEGFTKLSVETPDIAGLATVLKSRNVEFLVETKQSDRNENRSWFMIEDPDGNLIQVFGETPVER